MMVITECQALQDLQDPPDSLLKTSVICMKCRTLKRPGDQRTERTSSKLMWDQSDLEDHPVPPEIMDLLDPLGHVESLETRDTWDHLA